MSMIKQACYLITSSRSEYNIQAYYCSCEKVKSNDEQRRHILLQIHMGLLKKGKAMHWKFLTTMSAAGY